MSSFRVNMTSQIGGCWFQHEVSWLTFSAYFGLASEFADWAAEPTIRQQADVFFLSGTKPFKHHFG